MALTPISLFLTPSLSPSLSVHLSFGTTQWPPSIQSSLPLVISRFSLVVLSGPDGSLSPLLYLPPLGTLVKGKDIQGTEILVPDPSHTDPRQTHIHTVQPQTPTTHTHPSLIIIILSHIHTMPPHVNAHTHTH